MKLDYLYFLGIGFLLILSVLILNSIAPSLFPVYFLYLVVGIIIFLLFLQIDFEIVSAFWKHFYVFGLIFLILPLLIGQVTRGTVRWIPIGALTIQPGEIVRPFILIFFAAYFTEKAIDLKRMFKGVLLFLPIFLLIVIQPSLGVALITLIGFLGILLASDVPKKYFLFGALLIVGLIPLVWQVLAPYQRTRIISFTDPQKDPLGTGYNSIQSMIAAGSGEIFGRGLGRGIQTQLSFLPERHTDFIFAGVAEELGLAGAILMIVATFFVFYRLILFMENAVNPAARAYLAGLFATLFVQTAVHIGMNLGLLPITGLPYPLVSAGGSSLIATLIGLAIAVRTRKS